MPRTPPIKPDAFDVLDLYMGLQREVGNSLIRRPAYYNVTPALYAILSNYTHQGGALLVSGSYLGEESLRTLSSKELLKNVLHADFEGCISNWEEQVVCGLGLTLEIPRWINPEQYPVVHPEILTPLGGAFTPFVYGYSRNSAAVAYNGNYRSVVLGFPFEAIRSQCDRDVVMLSLLDYLNKKE